MASEVSICNLSIGHLGEGANVQAISPPDGSQEADWCAQFYPIARDQLIGMHSWGFATKRQVLALLDTDELPDTWLYAYTLPAECLQPIAVLPPQAAAVATFDPSNMLADQSLQPSDLNAQNYVSETLQNGTKVIFTNVEDAILRYVVSVSDTTKFSPLFVTALARLLASYLAGPMLKGETGRKEAAAQLSMFYKVELPMATGMDAKAQRASNYKNFTPDALQSRR